MKKLLESIVLKLDEEFEDYRKYLSKEEGGFIRPSFFIYVISNKQTIINKSIYEQNITVRITYLDSLDGDNSPNKLRQVEVGDKLLNLFSDLSLNVDNRFVKISESVLGFTEDDNEDMYVQVTFNSYKNREENLKGYELMEDVDLEV